MVNKAKKTLITQYELKPTMLLIQVGSDPASITMCKTLSIAEKNYNVIAK
jgi:hypothetical protein